MLDIQIPPHRFDHPFPPAVILQLPRAEVDDKCRALGASTSRAIACAIPGGDDFCLIVMPKDVSPTVHAALLRHEHGHCNGWAPHHPE